MQAAPLNPKRGDEHKAASPLVDGRKVMGLPAAAVSGTAYCFASGSMVLLNKAALSSFSFDAPTCLLFFQCAVCVLLVRLASLFGLVKLEPWSWKIARVSISTAETIEGGQALVVGGGTSEMLFWLGDPAAVAVGHAVWVALSCCSPGAARACRRRPDGLLEGVGSN